MNQLTAPSVFRKFSQLICTAASVVSMSLAVFPSTAQAAGADGNFRVTSGKGSITINGDTQQIPKSVFNEVIKDQSSAMVVRGQKLKINRNVAGDIVKALADEGVFTDAKTTGPSSTTLKPVGNYFTGKNLQPIVTKLSGVYKGDKISVTAKTNVSAKVVGKTLTLTTRFSATDGENGFSGVITLVGKR